jgi:hypothetical protein
MKAETESEKIAAQYLALQTKYRATKLLKTGTEGRSRLFKKKTMRHSHCISLPSVGKAIKCEVT